ncbi:MAG: hypothetical protein GVY11_06365 [Gammaproteobacteria bacterium]|jgi:hypothetical protein|nr:hypothetical protein [Gammaproteobacteria bacterium]
MMTPQAILQTLRNVLLALLAFWCATEAAHGVWPSSAGGDGDDNSTATVVGPTGAVYITGTFSGEAVFGDGVTISARGPQDIYVARYTAAGTLDWVTRAGSSLADRASDIALDESGDIYVSGQFSGQADFGSTELSSDTLDPDVFVAKLDASGQWQWAKSATGEYSDEATSLVLLEGDITTTPPTPTTAVVGGYYECELSFFTPESGPFEGFDETLDNPDECGEDRKERYFLASIDSDGKWQWVMGQPENGDGFGVESRITDLDVSESGSVAALADAELQTGNFFIGGNWLRFLSGFWALNTPGAKSNVLELNEDFDLTTTDNPRLQLLHRWSLDQPNFCYDIATMDYSVDGGDSWQRVNPGWFTSMPFNSPQNGLENNPVQGLGWCYQNPLWDAYVLSDLNLSALSDEESVRFRWVLGEGEAVGGFGWQILLINLFDDNGSLFGGVQDSEASVVGRLANIESGEPEWSWTKEAAEGLRLEKIRFAPVVDSTIYAVGESSGGITLPEGTSNMNDAGAAVVSLSSFQGDFQWGRSYSGGAAKDIAVDGGDLFVGGDFIDFVSFFEGEGGTLESAGNSDLFVAKVSASDGLVEWATGGDRYNEDGGIPAKAGGTGDAEMTGMGFDGLNNLYVTGNFDGQLIFGQDAELFAPGGRDIYLANISTLGGFFEVEGWTVGEPITPPPNADLSSQGTAPEVFINGEEVNDAIGTRFFWNVPPGEDGKLYPLDVVPNVELRWRVIGEPPESDERIVQVGQTSWPTGACSDGSDEACYQVHIAGAPAEVEAAGSGFRYLDIFEPSFQASNAAVDSGVFNADVPGFSVLMYVEGSTPDPFQNPISIDVVRTMQPSLAPGYVRGVRWTIGEPIVEPYHNEPGRTGYVLNEDAFYDGVGEDAAYDRAARTGHIIPVNRTRPGRIQDAGKAMQVAWYRRNAKGVYWPKRAIQYAPNWPLDPERIIIASQQGAENLGQAPLSPIQYPDLRIYQQPVPSEPGYNPNAAHAFFAPSNTGSGILALFALRADFGINLPDDTTSATDPYVLVKYYDEDLDRWAFRTFYVTATGAGFDGFDFTGEAGTAVQPPYPLSLLPGCAESRAVGQAVNDPQPPPPFFTDYKNGLWSKSAGSGAMRFWYPLQPGMVYDIDNNDLPDSAEGTCVPWMARLPVEDGGTLSPNLPIEVGYSFSWPTSAPQLLPGETLLTQKRGLPNILGQDAVEIVFDEFREDMEDAGGAEPSDSLVQLIDPLNPRFVVLEELEGVATQLDPETGYQIITGSGDGLESLPVSIRQRLRYDPINQRLIFSGVFDDTIAGDPLLLLNVMSFREARILKTMDGSAPDADEDMTKSCESLDDECSWSEAIEALLRLTRNPNGINYICLQSQIDGNTGERVCTLDRTVDRGELLIAYQDPVVEREDFEEGDPNQGLIEPYQASGVRPALTAGAAQSVGWVTVAFNNDPQLNPAPVSLSIMRVDCLRNPPPPDPPDILSPYQGQLNVIAPDNIFDEQLTLRHSGDFGGDPDALEFEWYFRPDQTGLPPEELPDPDSGQLNGWFKIPVENDQGAIEVVIEGANIQTLSDNWYLARYQGLPVCENQNEWSLWAGQPGATPTDQRAQLGQGWVNRVLARLNPFEARVQDFHSSPTNTYASMLVQLGERYEGDIPLTSNPDVLNSIGLIEAYTTVMRRAMDLSVNATPPVDYGPVNNAILNVSTRILDFYALLGNEAYADAQDPTIGLLTSGDFESFAPTIFPFQNQTASLLDEELILLRGRDGSQGPTAANPVYNRFFWNFTTGDGEVAYALNYGITDQNTDGVIDEFDARIQYPQGHGDAWGHYLTGLKTHYDLLRHPFFTWNPRADAVPVAGVPLQVDFFDERKFAQVAAAKARTGAEIVNLTYRRFYVEDPMGQWQGYKDDDEERAWGLSEWARRAGQGAFFDWVVANAILPDEDPDPGNGGIQRIDRTTVEELDEIIAQFDSIQGQLDQADRGLNPLGLARDVVPFDIDPSQVDTGDSPVESKTHFEQVFERAETALDNAVEAWDFANQLNRMLRFNQDSAEDLTANARATERDFKNRLIEIYGYPYADDLGPGGVYPADYDGPDLYHYMYIDVLELAGEDTNILDGFDVEGDLEINRFDAEFGPMAGGVNFFDIDEAGQFSNLDCEGNPQAAGCALGATPEGVVETMEMVTYRSPAFGMSFGKPPEWNSRRRATGTLQNILHDMFSARLDLARTLEEYDQARQRIQDKLDEIAAVFNIRQSQLEVSNNERDTLNTMSEQVVALEQTGAVARTAGEMAKDLGEAFAECLPKNLVAGLAAGGDFSSAGRCSLENAGLVAKSVADGIGQGFQTAGAVVESNMADVSLSAAIDVQTLDNRLELFGLEGELTELLRREPLLRVEIFQRAETIEELFRKYQQQVAEGQRVLSQLIRFRKKGAAATQEYRYQDMAFRIFRNDALQKYRATFDLAARYVYLAAAAYDYETNLLGSDQQAGQKFLTDIVRERSIGQIIGGEPVAGSRGLADPMARMAQNFEVLKGQMGFNNPQVETNRFSLRRELFRIDDGEAGDEAWRRELENARVDNLWDLPAFRRFARPPQPESAGPLPGLVFRFPTTVTFGLNFFHWPLGPGDSTYDASRFSTKVRGVGTWFRDYAGLPLTETPRIYMFPVGADVLRAPTFDDFSTRQWQIVDQVLPVPFPIGQQELEDSNWIPLADSLSDSFNEIRRYSQFRAHHYTEPFDETQIATDSRLIGRSVWNREWVVIIPGGSLLSDPNEGLDTFINGQEIGDSGERDGLGVSDIRIFFNTYSYSGN